MPRTDQVTVTDATWFEIKALSDCRKIVFREHTGVGGYPTTGFLIAAPDNINNPEEIVPGDKKEFNQRMGSRVYRIGETIAWAKAKSGSTTFSQYEE